MSILQSNGGCCVAMSGEQCFAIASDLGLVTHGINITDNCPKAHRIHDRLFLGLSGLATDRQTVLDKLNYRCNMYRLREERDIPPPAFLAMMSNMLYERRFGPWFVEPIVAGFHPDNRVFLASMDLIGAKSLPEDFVCTGTSEEALFGICEALWRPGLDPEALSEVISRALFASLDRDPLSGWGVIVHIVTLTKIITRTFKAQVD